eukprot:TRINITY_DN105862_c0_g1_i1.p1 TRINITY_DN105862_c0_g1~~TRINITY_DN105862_c0_g1_i1.p1  ORF type:complete len:316 (-),score=23.42 TRINITY_DN105862_c0_g1_i1:639-1586(-)
MKVLTAEQVEIVNTLTNNMRNTDLPLEELNKRHERLKKFGFPREEVRDPPVEPVESATFLKDSFYVYGVDYMSTEDVKTYFGKYELEAVNWLNDSSCIFIDLSCEHKILGTIKFKSEKDANEAMEIYGKGEVEGKSKIWRKGGDAEFNGRTSQIIFRFATPGVCLYNLYAIQDVKEPMVSGRDSKYYKRVAMIAKRSKGIRKHKVNKGFDLGLKGKESKQEEEAKVENPSSEVKKEEMIAQKLFMRKKLLHTRQYYIWNHVSSQGVRTDLAVIPSPLLVVTICSFIVLAFTCVFIFVGKFFVKMFFLIIAGGSLT